MWYITSKSDNDLRQSFPQTFSDTLPKISKLKFVKFEEKIHLTFEIYSWTSILWYRKCFTEFN